MMGDEFGSDANFRRVTTGFLATVVGIVAYLSGNTVEIELKATPGDEYFGQRNFIEGLNMTADSTTVHGSGGLFCGPEVDQRNVILEILKDRALNVRDIALAAGQTALAAQKTAIEERNFALKERNSALASRDDAFVFTLMIVLCALIFMYKMYKRISKQRKELKGQLVDSREINESVARLLEATQGRLNSANEDLADRQRGLNKLKDEQSSFNQFESAVNLLSDYVESQNIENDPAATVPGVEVGAVEGHDAEARITNSTASESTETTDSVAPVVTVQSTEPVVEPVAEVESEEPVVPEELVAAVEIARSSSSSSSSEHPPSLPGGSAEQVAAEEIARSSPSSSEHTPSTSVGTPSIRPIMSNQSESTIDCYSMLKHVVDRNNANKTIIQRLLTETNDEPMVIGVTPEAASEVASPAVDLRENKRVMKELQEDMVTLEGLLCFTCVYNDSTLKGYILKLLLALNTIVAKQNDLITTENRVAKPLNILEAQAIFNAYMQEAQQPRGSRLKKLINKVFFSGELTTDATFDRLQSNTSSCNLLGWKSATVIAANKLKQATADPIPSPGPGSRRRLEY